MFYSLFWGNFFSFISSICLAISVAQRNKHNLIKWLILNTIFCILCTIALCTYAALCTEVSCLIRNLLAYKNRLTKNLTIIITILCVGIGLYVNNLGIFGYFPLVATASYTIAMYITKNEQQMRYALIINLMLWLVHAIYVKAYPGMVTDILISLWTALLIYNQNHPIKNHLFRKLLQKFSNEPQICENNLKK